MCTDLKYVRTWLRGLFRPVQYVPGLHGDVILLLGFSTRHRQSTLFPTRFQYQYSARTMLRYQQTQQSNDATCTVCVFYNKHLCRRRCRRRLRCDWYSKDPVSCILCMELPRDVLNGKKRHGFSCRSHGWSNLATQDSRRNMCLL